MSESQTHIFLSYAKEDTETARRLYFDLRNMGFKAWMDSEDLLPGQRWKETIRLAIRASELFLVLISRASLNKRGFVQSEINQALEILDEFPRSEIFVIPIRLEECDVSDERLSGLHWVDVFPSYARGFEKLLRSLPPELSRLAAKKKERETVGSYVVSVDKERSELYHEFLQTTEEVMNLSEAYAKLNTDGDAQAAGMAFRKSGDALEKLQRLLTNIKLVGSETLFAPAAALYALALRWRYSSLTSKLSEDLGNLRKEYLTKHLPSFKVAAREDIGVFSIGDQAVGK